jgi:small-conductance mechanosensitive channel
MGLRTVGASEERNPAAVPARRDGAGWVVLLVVAVLLCGGVGSDAASAKKTTTLRSADQITKDLTAMIDWYDHVNAFTNTPVSVDEALYRDSVKSSASEAVRLAFDLARAEAQLLATTEATPSTGPATSRSQSLAAAGAAATQQIGDINAALADIDQQLAHGPTTQPADVLSARRAKLVAELNLTTERRDVIMNFASFMTGSQSGAAELLQKIDDLERTVPGLPANSEQSDNSAPSNDNSAQSGANGQASNGKSSNSGGALSTLASMSPAAAAINNAEGGNASSSGTTASADPAPFRPETAGIFGLVSELFSLQGRMTQITGLQKEAEPLMTDTEAQRAPLRAQLVAAVHQGDVLSKSADANTASQLDAETSQLESLGEEFRLLAAAAVPLSEQGIDLKATNDRLKDWHDALADTYTATLRYLLVRLALMMGSVLVVLVVSRLWQRATFKYVKEPRKRRVFLLVRRLVTTVLIGLILLTTFVTEFGSIATFAGLITAGIAVALQSIILAGVAYFFVMGRYGIRVGDRLTVNNITGDVVDTGLFRFYLMELSGNGFDLHPTGRIVVFSNAVLFQASAFYKQMPGAEYTWHEVSMTLSPDSDYKLAQDVLMQAVESVFNNYKDRIAEQHHVAASQVHLPMQEPQPQGRLRFVDAGLEFAIRYPVEISQASEVDDQITRALLAKIESEPKLKMVISGTPRIQRAT